MYEYSELMKVSEVKLSYKISANRSEMPIISETNEAKRLMAGLFDEDQIEYNCYICNVNSEQFKTYTSWRNMIIVVL